MTINVLETTIRDGGYEISHQFTEEDVALVVSILDAAGVSYIEIGYGMGVGSQKFAQSIRPKERPAAGDFAHMSTAKAAARRAKVGVLYGAGDIFCPVEYLDEVAAAGMDFVRLAFMPGDVTPANMRYVERARKLGMLVSINCMQTYLLTPTESARLAAMCESAGAEWWYVVDSAGGMTSSEIKDYVRAAVDSTGMRVGLHAHNNLGMAVANSLAAVEAGATLVDSTLNGLGRATGNAPTEQLLLALQRMGHEAEIDVDPLARLSQMYRVLFEDKGNSPMNFVSGASLLHSRNVPAVMAQAKQREVSVADFMVRVGREARAANCLDRFVFPPEVFDRAAEGCKRSASSQPTDALVQAISARIGSDESIKKVCEDLGVRSARYHVPSVLHLVSPELFPFEGAIPWQSGAVVGVSAPWSAAIDPGSYRQPDYVLVDRGLAGKTGLPTAKQRTFTCTWDDLWSDAIRAAVAGAASTGSVWLPVLGDPRMRGIGDRLRAAGFELIQDRPAGDRVVVVASSHDSTSWTPRLHAGDIVVVVDRGSQARVAVDAIRRAGAHALTPAIGSVVAGRAHELITVSAQVAPLLTADAAALWVDPLLAPGTGQAVVDVGLSAIVEPGPHKRPELLAKVADARARTLVNGTGRP